MTAIHCTKYEDLKAAVRARRAFHAASNEYQDTRLSPEEVRLELQRLEARVSQREALFDRYSVADR